jgi:hypothetical protein
MNVMVMDVEGTDGRERGEDQVRVYSHLPPVIPTYIGRILNANPHCSR